MSDSSWQDFAGIEQTPMYSFSGDMSTPGAGMVQPEYQSFYDLSGVTPTLNYDFSYVDPSIYQQTSWLDSLGLGGLNGKDWATLGLGGLSLLGNLYENRQNRNIQKGQLALGNRQLSSSENEDIAKTAALLNLLQNRQGVVTNPQSYEAVRRGSPLAAVAERPIVDIGGKLGNRGPVKAATGGNIGALRLVQGGTGGQDDAVNARLSDGEYVFDADSVSALGDGNTEAGAAKLDKMRENIRRHKRSASPKKIPPKAKSPEQYLRGGKA